MTEFIPILACGAGPLLAISLTLQAAGAAASYMGQKQAARKQKAYQDHLADMQREAAQRRVASLHTKALQEQTASAQKIEAVRQEADRVASQARLSAEAGNVAGLSMGHIIQSHEAIEGRYRVAAQEEEKMRMANVDRMSSEMMLAAEQQMASTQAPISQPNLLASALTFGAKASGSLMDYGEGRWWDKPGDKKSKLGGVLSSGPGTSFKPTGRSGYPTT
jgi:hypothetical protein